MHATRSYSEPVDLPQLRAFVAVSRARTIAAAAEVLHVTPSPLSRTIKELERQVRGALFTRNYHELLRTDLGDQYLPLAVEIVRQADEFDAVATGSAPPFRFGATPWTSKRITRHLGALVAEQTTGAEFDSELSSVLLESIRHGDLDLALVHLPADVAGLSSVTLARYRYSVITMHPEPLDLGRPLLLSDLAGMNVLSLPMMMQPVPMQRLLDGLRRGGVASIAEIDLRDIVGMQMRMARTGEVMLGTSSEDLPTSRFFDFESMRSFPVADDEVMFEVGLVWRTRSSLYVDEIQTIVEAMRPTGPNIPIIE